MKVFVPVAISPEPATNAPVLKVVGAFAIDFARLILPWFVVGILFIAFPGVASNAAVAVSAMAIATIWSVISLWIDIHWLKHFGGTRGLLKRRLRIVDPALDELEWQARLIPKGVLKLLLGKYEIIDIS